MMRWFWILIMGLSLVTSVAGCGEETTSTTAAPKPQAAAKALTKAPPPLEKSMPENPEKKKFVYQAEGRRDPFMPLTAIKKPLAKSGEPTTPLQGFELNQYRLIGVIVGKNQPRAMVVAPDGRTYILTKGLKIGKNEGVIIEINENVIRVEEKYYDFSGNVRINMQEIVVPKRGGV